MKNLILLPAFMVLSFNIHAQEQIIGIDFSGNPEFAIGDINGQFGWQAMNADGFAITGCNIAISPPDETFFSQCLSVGYDPEFEPSENGNTFECMSPSLIAFPFTSVTVQAALSYIIDTDTNPQTVGSDYAIAFRDDQGITSSVCYFADGSIKVLDIISGINTYVDTGTTWSPHTWSQIYIDYNFLQGTIRYLIAGEVIYVGHLLQGRSLDRLVISHNNQPGSTGYFDSLFVFGYSEFLSTAVETSDKIAISQSPSGNTITISNQESILLKSANIISANGQAIKSINLSGNNDKRDADLSDLPSGMYIIRLLTSDGDVIKKIIKR